MEKRKNNRLASYKLPKTIESEEDANFTHWYMRQVIKEGIIEEDEFKFFLDLCNSKYATDYMYLDVGICFRFGIGTSKNEAFSDLYWDKLKDSKDSWLLFELSKIYAMLGKDEESKEFMIKACYANVNGLKGPFNDIEEDKNVVIKDEISDDLKQIFRNL